MYKIRHRIIKPVLITEEGGEKTCMIPFDGYGCVYTQRHTHSKRQKHACHVPAGIKLALSCTVCRSLEKHHNDSGVQTMKHEMLESLKRRYADAECNEILTISTLLDLGSRRNFSAVLM